MARKPRREGEQETSIEGVLTTRPKFSLYQWLRNSFFAGIVVAAPVTVTIWLIYTFISFVDRTVKPLIPARYLPESYLPFAIPGFGVVVAMIALTLLGALAANILGRTLLQFGERLVSRVPLVREVYGVLKQVVETVFSSSTKAFKEVVLVEFPRPGLWSIGFLSAPARGEIAGRLGDDYIGVFVPTVPNPTTGFIMWAKRSELIPLKITIEQGAKLVLSAGIVTPELVREQELEKAFGDKDGDGIPDSQQQER
jgi:uncharacterized membrane protein